MDTLPLKYHPWSDRLAMDIALLLEGSGEDITEVLTRHAITSDHLGRYNTDPLFLKKVDHLRGEVRENGLTFRMKAKAQAEELLTTSWTLIHSPEVSAAVKADLIKWTGKMAGYEPRKDQVITDAGGGVSITINLGEVSPALPQVGVLPQGPPVKVIEHVDAD